MGGVICFNKSFEYSDSLLFRDEILKECEGKNEIWMGFKLDLILKFIICFLATPQYCSSCHVYAIIICFAKSICEQNFKRPIIIWKKL